MRGSLPIGHHSHFPTFPPAHLQMDQAEAESICPGLLEITRQFSVLGQVAF
jgi:hypothetical protein